MDAWYLGIATIFFALSQAFTRALGRLQEGKRP